MSSRSRIMMAWLSLLAMSCVTPDQAPETSEKALGLDEVLAHVPASTKDRRAWAKDILDAIASTKKLPTRERVCAVIAIIEQESGYQENPTVANLPHLVREGLLQKFAPLGRLAEPAMTLVLSGTPPGSEVSFAKRIDALRTERDLDRFFRDMAQTYREGMPGPYLIVSAVSKILGKGYLQDLNPVTTIGSMQVKVSFARTLDGMAEKSDDEVREWLYTRKGGVQAGAHRLLDYEASYGDIIFRFADYNTGIYSSRNAAFQAMLTDLTTEPLALDGDLQAYDELGEFKGVETKTLHALHTFGAAHDKWNWTIDRDVKREKTRAFEETSLWRDVRDAWEDDHDRPPPYARIPVVTLNTPKLARKRTSEWYANAVKRRYLQCQGRS